MSSDPQRPFEQNPARHHFKCKNQLSDIAKLSQSLIALASSAGYSTNLQFAIDLVTEELITNIINYAFQNDAEQIISIDLLTQEQKVTIIFQDDGVPFNPFEDYDIQLPKSLDDAGLGGLGIHLVKSYAQSYEYKRQGNQNIVSVTLVENV